MRTRFFLLSLICACAAVAQKKTIRPVYTHDDTLKGAISAERAWWDAGHYDLSVRFFPADSSIAGVNTIRYKVLQPGAKQMQIDLMAPMVLDSAWQDNISITWRKDGNAYFLQLPGADAAGAEKKLGLKFHGKPVAAKMPPWDGGVVWSKDKKGKPWISVACQGMSARVWFPNKDHMYDEVSGCDIRITTPPGLVAVSNGKMRSVTMNSDSSFTYHWSVVNPINNYNIIPYIGRYVSFKDTFNGEAGTLDLDYWVLQDNFDRARQHFAQVKPMLRCFEYWFGAYPFYEDGYKLVEAPYLGMEHQSAIAYGNEYLNGYKGRDLSNTGWGLKWDFIIIHESGHEWFGNNISARDVADNWIHESFTAYSENLYTEFLFGKKAGAEYVIGTRKAVLNDKPVISDYHVNAGGSLDIYYKGSNMLHTIRQLVNNDSLWRAMLRGLNREFRHQTVTSKQIEDYMIGFLKLDLQHVFDQYLRTVDIPVLEYRIKGKTLSYRYKNCVKGFDMPLKMVLGSKILELKPSEKWKDLPYAGEEVKLDENYFVILSQLR